MKTILIRKADFKVEIIDMQDTADIASRVICVDTRGVPCAYPGHAEPGNEARAMKMIELNEGDDLDDILQWDLIAEELTPQLTRITGESVEVVFI